MWLISAGYHDRILLFNFGEQYVKSLTKKFRVEFSKPGGAGGGDEVERQEEPGAQLLLRGVLAPLARSG